MRTDGVGPAVGAGVTMYERGASRPGTIIEVSDDETAFWFRLDDGTATRRAVLAGDGVFREEHDMWRLDVGVRRTCTRRDLPPPGARDVLDLVEAVERVEPFLLKTDWPPMTYMAIPSVLRAADELLAELATFDAAPTERVRVDAVKVKLARLRAGFHRV